MTQYPELQACGSIFYAGLIERWGSGTLRIVEELSAAGHPPPRFESEAGRFRLAFYKQVVIPQQSQALGLSKRQQQGIAHIKAHGSISNSENQSIAGISKSTATRELNYLKEAGVLYAEGKTGRGTIYRLKQ